MDKPVIKSLCVSAQLNYLSYTRNSQTCNYSCPWLDATHRVFGVFCWEIEFGSQTVDIVVPKFLSVYYIYSE